MQRFLDGAYSLGTPDAARSYYGQWAATYDAEITDNGYATPDRCARALATVAPDKAAPVLDIGCGTGLSGAALHGAGFTVIDGIDISPEMLAQAGERGLYRTLTRADISACTPFAAGEYAHAVAVGVMSPQHAPAGLIDAVIRALPPGGCFVFSLNDHVAAHPSFEGRVRDLVDCGCAEVVLRELGPHLPGIGLRALVYVLRKRGGR